MIKNLTIVLEMAFNDIPFTLSPGAAPLIIFLTERDSDIGYIGDTWDDT